MYKTGLYGNNGISFIESLQSQVGSGTGSNSSLIIPLIILLERLLESMTLCGSVRWRGQSHVALIKQLTHQFSH